MNTTEQKSGMRQIIFIVFIILFVCTMITPGIAQEKPTTDKNSKPSKVIIRVRSKGDFVGTVSHVNMVSKTITVRNKGIVVTFDVLNPVFKGYKNLEQIRVGDKIAISYTGDGARITKAIGIYSVFQQEIAKPISESTKQKHASTKTNKEHPVRIKERTNSRHFRDVDNNNDGRITPVELSAVVPNLTVEDFKKYDRNGDGYLNEAEYNAINKSVTHGYNR
ncbi:MAG: EF-hand domain-containing protein [Proteobacteria bacterium]|nr:EF-hand domain-containing protein [Pseudomonadota bacterium]